MFRRCFSIFLLILLIFASSSNAAETPGCKNRQERLNKLSGGLACIPGFPSGAVQLMICKNDNCKCWIEKDATKAECDKNPKTGVIDCDGYAALIEEKQKIIVPKESMRNVLKEFCSGAEQKGDSGAETIGSGFTLLMVSLVASFFL